MAEKELEVTEQKVEEPKQEEKPKKKKKGKGLIIGISVTLVTLAVIYFVGGTILGYFAIDYFMKQRNTKESDLTTFYNKVFDTRKDLSYLNTREEIIFKVSDKEVKGYLYEAPSPKGIIIGSHDVMDQSDGSISQAYNYFVQNGYDVFAFDHLGCGRSAGDGIVSMYQSKYTVLEAIKAVKGIERLSTLDVMLFGHSFGGYGVVAASGDENVKAVAALGAYNNARDMLYQYALDHISQWLVLLTPDFDIACNIINSKEYYHNCAEEVAKYHESKKFLIAHGTKDTSVNAKASLLGAVKGKNYSNVTCVELQDLKHDHLWNTADAAQHTEEVIKNYEQVKARYNGNIPEDVYAELVATADKARNSALNEDLLHQIVEMYDSAVSNH